MEQEPLFRCPACGGDLNSKTHDRTCDAKQGHVEAAFEFDPHGATGAPAPEPPAAPEPPPNVVPAETFEAYARRSDPFTSQAAAASCHVQYLEWLTIEAFHYLGIGNSEDAIAWIKLHRPGVLHRDSVSPRLAPLEKKGLMQRIGIKKTHCGKASTMWQLTEAGARRYAGGYHGRRRHART